MISPAQCRAARAWLALDQQDLAKRAGLNTDTLWRFESGRSGLRPTTEAAIRGVLETMGIAFTFGRNGEPIGIEQKT